MKKDAQNSTNLQDSLPSTVRPVNVDYSNSRGGFSGKGKHTTTALMGPMDASEYSRKNFKSPKKHRRVLIALIISMVFVLLIGGVAFGGYMYINSISDKMNEGVDDALEAALATEEAASDEPFYMLIIGMDESEERAEESDTFRSDSIILARVDPQEKTVTLISIERDTYVYIEGYGANKINAAAAYGGAALIVETVEEFAGVEISHYVSIDFDGFAAAVDALGGIEVDVPMTIDDDDAGGYIEAGLQTLTGDQALILCRSRHAYDSYGSGDYYRMANQRLVLGAIAEKLLSSDPVTMATTINAMADYITTDLDMSEIVDIATQMRGMDTDEDIYSAANPTISSYIDGVWYEICDLDDWQEMMARVDAGLTPYEDEERSANTGGTLDGTVTGTQETGTESAELSETATADDDDDEDEDT